MTLAASTVLALFFAITGAGKLVGHPASLVIRDRLGIAVNRWQQIGTLELAGAAGVLIGLAQTALGVVAAAGLALLSLGAIATHIVARDRPLNAVPAVLALALAGGVLALQAGSA